MVGIVGGVVGFMVLALLLMSFVLYILVRRSVEKRQARNETAVWVKERRHSPSQSRSSVAASDSPEVPLPIPLFTFPKVQVLYLCFLRYTPNFVVQGILLFVANFRTSYLRWSLRSGAS